MGLLKEIREIPSTQKALREFGWVMGAFFALLSAFVFWKKAEVPVYWIGLSAVFLVLGQFLPATLKPVQKIWMALALCLGWVMSRVILTVIFYLVFTPIGFFLKLSGNDLLNMNWARKENSYWKDHAPRSKESYEKQF